MVARVAACSRAVVSGWAWTVSPSLPCALIHRMCSMNSHPSPSCCCFLLECTPPFPEWPGFPLARLCRWTGRVASQQPVTPSFRELVSVLEQPMMESGDGREAGGSLVGRVGVRGGTGGDAVLLARKWGWAPEGVAMGSSMVEVLAQMGAGSLPPPPLAHIWSHLWNEVPWSWWGFLLCAYAKVSPNTPLLCVDSTCWWS